jgi:hypothetical protein
MLPRLFAELRLKKEKTIRISNYEIASIFIEETD